MNAIARFYDRIAPFYGIIHFFLKNGIQQCAATIDLEVHTHLLDLGMGLPISYLQHTRVNVIGIDIAPKMLNRKSKYYPQAILMDAANLQFDNESFDGVVVVHVLSVVLNLGMVLKEANRVLKPNGKLYVLNHFSENNIWGWVDKLLQPLASIFKFNLWFPHPDFEQYGFEIDSQRTIGWQKNYQIIILTKK